MKKEFVINIDKLVDKVVIVNGTCFSNEQKKMLGDELTKTIVDAVNNAKESVNKQQEYEFTDIKTLEDACNVLGISIGSIYSNIDSPDEIAYKKLKVIVRAINKGWIPDWNDTNQYKWWPWFKLSSGFGFDDSGYDYTDAYSGVGSRLCFQSKEKSNYCATQFIDLYKDLLTL